MIGAEDSRSTSFAYLSAYRISGQRRSDQRLNSHEANLTQESRHVQDSNSSLMKFRAKPRYSRTDPVRVRGSALAAVALSVLLSGCVRTSTVGEPGAQASPARPGGPPGGPPGSPGSGVTAAAEMQRLYRAMGLIAGTGSLSFVASISFLSAPSPDSTLVLLALSMPSRALVFTREADRYAAEYSVRVEARRGGTVVRQIDAKETVRVPTFRETARTDESVIWQQYLRLAPGQYSLAIGVKDESGLRSASEEVVLDVPRLDQGALGTPVAVYEAIPRTTVDSIPRLLTRPRSTVTFGSDSIIPIYVEAAGAQAPSTVTVRVTGDGDVELWSSSIPLLERLSVRSATIGVPVSKLAVGISNLAITAPGRRDTARTHVLVSLGDDLPIASFEEMLNYLRYFASAEKIRPLREATPAQRSDAWAKFLKDTDPVPGSAEHEGLRDYFSRLRTANQRYRDDGPIGWQTDRGMAFLGLGDPDNLYDSQFTDPNARVRYQTWEYRALRVSFHFVDQTGFGRWRLTPSERGELDNAIRRKLSLQP